jgi:hypothetical protein
VAKETGSPPVGGQPKRGLVLVETPHLPSPGAGCDACGHVGLGRPSRAALQALDPVLHPHTSCSAWAQAVRLWWAVLFN